MGMKDRVAAVDRAAAAKNRTRLNGTVSSMVKFAAASTPRRVTLMLTAAGAGLVFAASAGAAAVSVDPDGASRDASAMILGPLRAELDAPRPAVPAAANLTAASSAYSLRFAAQAGTRGSRAEFAPPTASSLAGALLTARTSDAAARDGLSAFAARPAVLAYTPSGGQLSVSISEGLSPSSARLGYDPAYAEAAGRAINPALIPDHRNMAVNYEGFFDAPGGQGGLDVGLSPRAGVSLGDDGPAARAGATVRFGRYLGALEGDRPAWWFFAGADRQAVLYDPGQGFDMRDALAMQPYAMVGDAQAGVAVRVGSADVSLAYVHRETRYALPQEDWETSEGFAAFSLTWKR